MNLNTKMNGAGWARLAGVSASLALLAALVSGCSGDVSPDLANNIGGPAVAVPVMITDAPSDQLVAFSLTLNSIVLTDSAGKTTSVLSTPTTVEICHLNGIQAPLVTANIPQDTYASALITFSNPQITYINSSGQPVVASPTLATTSYTATFPSPITITATSTSLLFDLLAAQSVTITGTSVVVSPVFSVKAVPPATAVPPMGKNGTGMQQMGTVVSVSGATLVVEPGSGPNITLTTNSSTVLQGFSSLSSLTAGELVQIDFVVQTGGVFLATRIQLAPPPPGGQPPNQLSGPVVSVTAGSGFKMALMQGLGPAVGPTSAGAIYTITTTSSTTYAITPQFVSLTGLPFTPAFTGANLTPGQTVGVTASSVSGTTATATNVFLVPQTLGGTVSAISTTGSYTVYTLALASGSAFSSLSGASTVTVYTSSATASANAAAIVVGSQVRFNGLVFSVGSGFSMVAGVCPDGAPGP
jgi:hypothetical protein